MSAATCQSPVRTGDWSPRRPCGRPFRTPEQEAASLCGIHLAAKRKREAGAAARAATARRDAERHAAAEAASARIESVLGVGAAWPFYHSADGGYTGGVVLSAEAMAEVLRRLEPAGDRP